MNPTGKVSGTGTLFDNDTETLVSYAIDDQGDAIKRRSPIGTIENIAPETLLKFENASCISLRLENGDVLQNSPGQRPFGRRHVARGSPCCMLVPIWVLQIANDSGTDKLWSVSQLAKRVVEPKASHSDEL